MFISWMVVFIQVFSLLNSGKGVVGNTSLVVDSSTAVPAALVGQKLVVAGNRVLVQGGKVCYYLFI